MYKNNQNKFYEDFDIKKKFNNKKYFYKQKEEIENIIKIELIYEFLRDGNIEKFMDTEPKINILNYHLFKDNENNILLVILVYFDKFLNNILLFNNFKIIDNIFDDEHKSCYVKKIKVEDYKNKILFKNTTLKK